MSAQAWSLVAPVHSAEVPEGGYGDLSLSRSFLPALRRGIVFVWSHTSKYAFPREQRAGRLAGWDRLLGDLHPLRTRSRDRVMGVFRCVCLVEAFCSPELPVSA
jgi:hypothetical protein